jgi:hypothetical protein
MRFRSGSMEFNATVAEASEALSPQTGDVLRLLTIQFRAQKADMHEQALEEAQLRGRGGLFSLPELDVPELEWRVVESTSSYVGSEPWGVNHHVWRIEQVERLACQRLLIGPLDLEPYEYVEQVAEDRSVRLAARALVSDVELKALAHLSGAFAVTRVGISDTARRMVLMGYVWGETAEGVAVALACEDVREPRVTVRGLDGPATSSQLDSLLATLRARGVLDGAEIDALRAEQHAARRVSDVNAWSLQT